MNTSKICRCEHIIWCDINDKCMKESNDERTETTMPTDRRPELGVHPVSGDGRRQDVG